MNERPTSSMALGQCPKCGRRGFVSNTFHVFDPLRAITRGGPCSRCGHILPDGPAHGVGAFEKSGVAVRRFWDVLLREVIEPITLPVIRWLTRKLGGKKDE